MSARNQLLFWACAALAFLGFVFVFKGVLLPFVTGIIVAYLLNPLVQKLGRAGMARGPASLLILSSFLAVVVIIVAALIPVLSREITSFAHDFPGYVARVVEVVTPRVEKLRVLLGDPEVADVKALAAENAGVGLNAAAQVMAGLAVGGSVMLNILSLAVIMPVAAYFMMKEWNRITDWVEGLMPLDKKSTILDLVNQIDRKLSGFIRGQLSVAFILAIFYATMLTIAGLKYGLLIGLGAGILSVIPLVGSAIGLVTAVVVAIVQTGDWIFVAIIAGIFLAGQLVEGNFLTPRLVGGNVGLHPLWVFFALMAGGSLFGILGMMLAVPVAAVASVLIVFGIRQYKSSPYYTGGKAPKKAYSKKRAL